MRPFVTMAALATLALSAATAANAASPQDRLTEMMTKLQGPEYAARPHSPEAKHWAIFNWLFGDLPDTADDEVITTMADPVEPPIALAPVPPVALDGLAPNRIYKRQIGKGQKMTVFQHGAGNTARVFQSN